MFFEDWFGIGIHYDFQYVFLKGFNMYHSLWILSRFLLNLKLLDIILILIIGRTLSPYFTEIIIYKVSLLWSKERIPTPSLQAKMHHAQASCEARFRLLTLYWSYNFLGSFYEHYIYYLSQRWGFHFYRKNGGQVCIACIREIKSLIIWSKAISF